MKAIPVLRIGDLEISPPILQGGMGIRVSKANLAAAVANEGCAGVIAAVGLANFEDLPGSEFVKSNDAALRTEIEKARSMTKGIIGVNVMVALSNYADLVRVSVEAGADLIISGAGLPLDLPKYIEGKDIKLVPIVSSDRAFSIICRKWKSNFNRLPDAVIVEGSLAGGHLGFAYDDVLNNTAVDLKDILPGVIKVANSFDRPIPVIAAGGIYTGEDIARYLKLGASGVQMATRFVCTTECDINDAFKRTYINARKEDIVIIKSPVGMPGRVIKNAFTEKILRGETIPFKCSFRCLKYCDPSTAPFCIAKVLANAAEGNMKESFVFAGSNAYRCTEIVPVKTLVAELVEGMMASI